MRLQVNNHVFGTPFPLSDLQGRDEKGGKMNYTKRPWKYESETKTIRSYPENYWLASMDSWDGAVNHEANARLIAAAPTMETAIRSMLVNMSLALKGGGEAYLRLAIEAGENALKSVEGKEEQCKSKS